MTRRHFLDWSEPCLPAAVDWIVSNTLDQVATADLSDVVCLTPGRRAGRQLLHLLAELFGNKDLCFNPPRCLTPGLLVQSMTHSAAPTPTDDERLGAWFKALRDCDADSLASLVPRPPGADDRLAWHALARTIMSLHEELAGQRRSFSDVHRHVEDLGGFHLEAPRWGVLVELHRSYLNQLDEAGLVDVHLEYEQALSRGLDDTVRRLVMIGVIELNDLQRAFVERLGDRIDVLIHAPPELEDHFDDLGCVRPESWISKPIELDDLRIVICDRYADVAREAMRRLAGFKGRYAAPEITIGLGDETLARPLRRDAAWAGLSLHAAGGIELTTTPPARLLKAVADWLDDQRFANFSELVRHPDLERWLGRTLRDPKSAAHGVAGWITLLDAYFTEHLHERLTGEWLGDAATKRALGEVHQAVQHWLAPLAGPARSRSDWAEPILGLLRTVYEVQDDEPRPERTAVTFGACEQILTLLEGQRHITESLQATVTATEAIELLLEDAAARPVAMDVEADQIEMLGWLELHLDLAPALILTGVNDGMIPQAVHDDAFLPDALRRQLGLMHNQRRYARDAYLMQAIVNSRSELALLAARRTEDGDPLIPSRLLLTGDGETIKRRIEMICAEPSSHAAPFPIGMPQPADVSAFTVPDLPEPLEPPEKMSVTDFRSYLACPYRYALARRLKLESIHDGEMELDPLQFGSLAHKVLEAFGADEAIRDSTDPAEIRSYLFRALRRCAADRFGPAPLPAVRVQLARLEQRLTGFARCQAEARRAGWRIRHCELKLEDDNELDIPEQAPMPIVGKIDRIDYHEEEGRWRILDYKTGDNQKSPAQTHVGRKTFKPDDELDWLDLQLPLYRFLAQRHAITGDVEVGYFVLPQKADQVNVQIAPFSPGQIDAALDRARQVVRDIRAGRFEINDAQAFTYDDYARICQTTVFTGFEIEDPEALEASP